ncbi:histone lysine demethylase PHF8-like isoform X1 [Microplitis mediator]|uniref:histone lysine demethylase PHF8-like isoform X1 n=1 Tax=Microplitis mediator TaxID=375433 RepID=UPI002555BB0E|nr:histone lysine demethylase PHF8-like isoform X1 [Microplitis mediator]
MMTDETMIYCLCGQSYNPNQFMIQCDVCKKWYHGECIGIKEYAASELDKYHCPDCECIHGPSLAKLRMNNHRHEYTDVNAESKPVQTGTSVFIHELKSRHFPKADDVVKHVRGQQLTLQYLQTNGFETPVIIDSKEGLDMTLPPSTFTVQDVEKYIGGDREIDVIDVSKQNNIRMILRDFVEYYTDPLRSRVLNVISLEFTDTGLSPLVEAPLIARKLDWVNSVWPREISENCQLKRPEVQKYCLMSVRDSFTDFHIDFGGTSVWYHVLRGEKIFYLIRPTPANLQLYQQWMSSSSQSETFFGDQVDACYKCIIKQGHTMMIPTGWIHAVLTPVDSLVFGGNFVHSLNIPMQIQIYELERKMKTPKKFQYPGFETINWFAAKRLLKDLKELNREDKKCPTYFLQGIKALLAVLKQWNTDKDYSTFSRGQIPPSVNSQKLLKELSKEIRHAERFLLALNPPKPERESKRKKKKPINKDFVNFDVADKMSENAFKATIGKIKVENSPVKNQSPIKSCLKLTLPKSASYPFNKSVCSDIMESKASAESPGYKRTISKQGKQSPTVIRFKLGDNEVVRSTNDKGNVFGNFAIDPTVETQKEFTWKQSSIYDFHDGSNESDCGKFTIDEGPKRKKSCKNSSHKKAKKSVNNAGNPVTVDVLSDVPKNGIEELLKASAYTLPSTGSRLEPSVPMSILQTQLTIPPPVGSDRASPSTREAIAGMLSFSEQCYSTESGSSKKSDKSSRKVEYDDEDDQSIENIDKVHQDEDFIYPALDASDDEEYIFKPRGKRRVDEAWNPKARVGPLLPKTNRPAREGAKKTSVEKGLEAAAAKRAKHPNQKTSPKRTYNKSKKNPASNGIIPTSSLKHEEPPAEPVQVPTGFTSILTSPNRLKDVKAKLAAPVPVERKPRKGMKTAKQRLGKILKLHKMMH